MDGLSWGCRRIDGGRLGVSVTSGNWSTGLQILYREIFISRMQILYVRMSLRNLSRGFATPKRLRIHCAGLGVLLG